MFKRFTIGFLLGVGAMYWYLENAEDLFGSGKSWATKSASGYRGDRAHDAAREVLGEKR